MSPDTTAAVAGDTALREMTSQPEAWEALIGRLQSGALALPVDPSAFDEVLLLGSGTSYYLALAAADWMRRRGIAARGVPSCEVLLDGWETRPSAARRLAIGFSRSGRSSELLLAHARLAAAGFVTLGVSCTEGSDLLTQVDHPVFVAEGSEEGLIMLRSFTSMLIAAQWFFGEAEDRAALAGLALAGRAMMGHAAELRRLAAARGYDRFVFLGSGPAYPLACEAALKIQEMAVATSEAYHTLDYRHGPKACADEGTVAVLFTPSDRALGLALARDVAALGATVIVIGADAAAYAGTAALTVPVAIPGDAAAAEMILPVQIFAHATAMRRGCDPDAPVNLSRVVTL